MSEERVSNANGDGDVQAFISKSGVVEAVAEHFGVEPEDIIVEGDCYKGFGSSVAVVGYSDEGEGILRVPVVLDDLEAKDIAEAYALAAVPLARAMIFIAESGEVDIYEYNPEIDSPEKMLGRYPFDGVVAVAMILELLPEGEELTNYLESCPEEGEFLFGLFGINLGERHSEELALDAESERRWRDIAVLHPLEGRERYSRSIAGYLESCLEDNPEDYTWISTDDLVMIEEDMRRVAEAQNDRRVQLVRGHGDSWKANVQVSKSANDNDIQTTLFDEALGVTYPGYDVGFAVGDQLVRWLVRKNESRLENSESFLRLYEEGVSDEVFSATLEEIWAPLAYKFIVGAAFDENEKSDPGGENRAKMVAMSRKLLNHALVGEDQVFSPGLLLEMWNSIE